MEQGTWLKIENYLFWTAVSIFVFSQILYYFTIREGYKILREFMYIEPEGFFMRREKRDYILLDTSVERFFALTGKEQEVNKYKSDKLKIIITELVYIFVGIVAVEIFGNKFLDNIFLFSLISICLIIPGFLYIYVKRKNNKKIILDSLNEKLRKYNPDFQLKKISIFGFRKEMKEFVTGASHSEAG